MFWRNLSCKVISGKSSWFSLSLINYDFEIENKKNVYVLIFVFLPKKGIVSKKLIKVALKF